MRVGAFCVASILAGCGAPDADPPVDAATSEGVPCDVAGPATVRVTALHWGLPKAGVAARSFTSFGEVVDLAMTDAQGVAEIDGCHYVGIMDGDDAWSEPLAGRAEVTLRSPRNEGDAPTVSIPVATENHPAGGSWRIEVVTECGSYSTQVPGNITAGVCAPDLTTPQVAAIVEDSISPNPQLAVGVADNDGALLFDTWSPVVDVPVNFTGVPDGAWGTRSEAWALVGANVLVPLRRLPMALPSMVEAAVNVDGSRLTLLRRRYETPPSSVDLDFADFPAILEDVEQLRLDGVPVGVVARLPEAMDDCGLTIQLTSGSRRISFTGPQPAGLVSLRIPRLPPDAAGDVIGSWVNIQCWNGGVRPRWSGDRIRPAAGVDLRMITGPARS